MSSLISADRIAADIEAIAACSENGSGTGPESSAQLGYSRPTFSAPWGAARDYVIAQAEAAGGEVRIDAAANVHIRHHSVGWDVPAWLCGSHIDSVPSGGKYDGVMGVVIPLEILRVAPSAPLELIIFAEEEGTTFNYGMIGSRLWAGAATLSELETILALTNRHGERVAEAGEAWGLDVAALRAALGGEADQSGGAGDQPHAGHPWAARLDPSRYLGMIEVHAEQGLSLWNGGVPVAAVSRINGRRQYTVTVNGQANHAGSTGMDGRRDALAAASELILAVERIGQTLARELPYTVATVGTVTVAPGAVNVIPGDVSLSIDVRAQDESMLARAEAEITAAATDIATRRATPIEVVPTEQIAPSPLSSEIAERLVAAARDQGLEIPIVPSGALHDAAIISPHVPTAMLFVASRDGISHNPAEYSRIEDIALAAEIVAGLVSGSAAALRRDAAARATAETARPASRDAAHHPGGAPTASSVPLSWVNTSSEDDVVARCGGFFEHSPWIVNRALAERPFASREAFHRACMEVIATATGAEREGLIAAHPDLVGRLAREGRLTAESTAEQAAAGLDALSPDEIEAFERYNEQYRTRFGFPFVICARRNRKEAILAAFPERLTHNREEEIATAIREIGEIAWLRLCDTVTE